MLRCSGADLFDSRGKWSSFASSHNLHRPDLRWNGLLVTSQDAGVRPQSVIEKPHQSLADRTVLHEFGEHQLDRLLNAAIRTIKESCLERMILFGEGSLRRVIQEFVMHYHQQRNHQGLGNRLIMEEESCAGSSGAIQRRHWLGGMLNYCYRQAA